MTIVDSSNWIQHFQKRSRDSVLKQLLELNEAVMHPYVVAELSMGGFVKDRKLVLDSLHMLPQVRNFEMAEVLRFVDGQKLYGIGLSYVDASILCSAVAFQFKILTLDTNLRAAASRFGLN